MQGLLALRAGLALVVLPGALGAQVLLGPPLSSPSGTVLEGYLAEADYDGDGQLDLLAAPAFGLFVTPRLMLGDGTGHFAPGIPTNLPPNIRGLSGADLDGDGLPDALTATAETVTRWIGHGDATFGDPLTVTTPGGLKTMTAADLDVDGALDMIVANEGDETLAGRLSVLHNAGDGTLSKVQDLPTLGTPAQPVVGDLDEDGLPDIVAAGSAIDGSGQWLAVHAGQPGLQFAPPATQLVGAFTSSRPSVTLAGLLGADHLDAAVTDVAASLVRVLRGNGQGALAPAAEVAMSAGYPYLRHGDLDDDGWPDLVLFGTYYKGITFATNAGGEAFDEPHIIPMCMGGTFRHGVVTDLNGDGRVDLLAMHGDGFWEPADARVLLNHTYAAGGPLLDLGSATPGYTGLIPVLLMDGTFLPGTPLDVSVHNLAKDVFSPGLVPQVIGVLGSSIANLPFKGTLLVPAPELLIGPFPVDAQGSATFVTTWPAGVPSGSSFVLQFLATGYLPLLEDWAATNATQVTLP